MRSAIRIHWTVAAVTVNDSQDLHDENSFDRAGS